LALVRAFPPDRDPQRFQAHRSAFEALCDQRKRLEVTLLKANDAALSRLKRHFLASAKPLSAAPSKATVCALLIEGATQALSPQESN